jgi:DNA-binding transcriptional regulator PaaX
MYKFGKIQKKIILVLLGGVALGMSRSPNQYYRALRAIKKDWNKINQGTFNRSIKRLTKEKFLIEKKGKDGSFELILTKKGRREASRLNFIGNTINIKNSKKWDKKWRVVAFDIPEKDRIFRGILRQHLFELDFYKLQNSVFVSPYPFEKPILELISLYSAEKYVRVITALKIDNEKKLKEIFSKKHKGFI